MATMQQIEVATLEFSQARAALVDVAIAFQNEINAVKLKHMHDLKTTVAAARAKHAELGMLIQQSPDLFKKPRTVMFHGVKVGYQKGKGKMEWEDTEQVVRLIKKHFADQADVLIITEEKPAKDALAQLTVDELKKVAITIQASGDQVVIKDTASEVDKLVAAFLKDEVTEAEKAEPERMAA
jgi:hypothetical protein